MDPVSGVASIVQLAELSAKAIVKTCRYLKALKGASRELRSLIGEVSAINGVLFGLRNLLEVDDTTKGGEEDSLLSSATQQPLKDCEEVLKEVDKLLSDAERLSNHSVKTIARGLLKRTTTSDDVADEGPVDLSTVAKYLLLPESIKEINKILERLGRIKSTLNLALVAQETSDIREIKQSFMPEKMRKLKDLLCSADPSSKHAAVVDQREKGTGEWLIKSQTFQDWESGKQQILWMSGIAGSGKTVLISRAIDHLTDKQSLKPDKSVEVAYFYCDFNDPGTTDEKSVLGGLLRCLLVRDSSLYGTFASRFRNALEERAESRTSEDTKTRSLDLLLSACNQYPTLYLIVDALDECRDPGAATKQLRDLAQQLSNIRILFSSREDASIQNEAAACSRLSINELNQVDLRQYVENELGRRAKLPECCVLMDASIRRMAAERIVKDAAGMFQWAVCQIDHISYLPNATEVRRSLDKLPPDLSTTYQTMIKGIAQRGTVYCTLAKRTLQILASTRTTKSLKARQLQEALAIDDSQDQLNSSAITDLRIILSACGKLVKFDVNNIGSSTAVSHQSIIDYLRSEQCRSSLSAAKDFYLDPSQFNSHMGIRCVKYLLFEQYFDMPTDDEMQKWKDSNSFYNYAIGYWIDHLAAANRQNWPTAMIRKFLGPEEPEYFNTYRKYCTKVMWMYTYPQIVCAVRVGSPDLVSIYVPSSTRGQKTYAISWATNDGRLDTLEELLKAAKNREADERINDWGTPLHRAIRMNRVACAKRLIDHGVDLTIQASHGTPLQAAVCWRRPDIIKLILEQKPNINFEGDSDWELDLDEIQLKQEHGSPRDDSEIGEELRAQTLRHLKAEDVARPSQIPQESHWAPDPEAHIVATVIKPWGMNKWNYGPPLTIAAFRGYDQIVEDLLKAGADVNKVHGGYGTALCAAAKNGKLTTLRKLIRAGADVNQVAGVYATALRAATISKDLSCVRALVNKGADVNARGTYFGTALKLAKDNGSAEIADYLIKQGAHKAALDYIAPKSKFFAESHLEALMDGFWTGYFFDDRSAQPAYTTKMRIRFFPSNSFAKVAHTDHMPLFGIGVDNIGNFDFEGIVTSNSRVSLIKTYKNQKVVWHYSGSLHENLLGRTCIGGSWGKPGKEIAGTFEIWRLDAAQGQEPSSKQSSGTGPEIFEGVRKPRKVVTLPMRWNNGGMFNQQENLDLAAI
ncbi:MAG: hypothetical protein Q9227_008194 [Pyrenula ochraceoflavens]